MSYREFLGTFSLLEQIGLSLCHLSALTHGFAPSAMALKSPCIQHIMLGCQFAKILWRYSNWPIDSRTSKHKPIDIWIKALPKSYLIDLSIPMEESHAFEVSTSIIMDAIWYARNNKIYNEKISHILCLFEYCLLDQTDRCNLIHHMKAWHDSKVQDI